MVQPILLRRECSITGRARLRRTWNGGQKLQIQVKGCTYHPADVQMRLPVAQWVIWRDAEETDLEDRCLRLVDTIEA